MIRSAKVRTAMLVLVAMVVTACGGGSPPTSGSSSSAKPPKIVIGIQSQDIQPEDLIQPMGWFEKQVGVPVEYRDFNGGGAMNAAIQSGGIDIAELGMPPFSAGLNKGIPYQLIYIDNSVAHLGEGLVTRKGVGINSPKDLVGKDVATPFGSSADFMLNGALVHSKVDPNAVHVINLAPGAIQAAWTRGDINATYIWAPVLSQLISQGGQLMISDDEVLSDGYFPGDVIVVGNDFAKKYPDTVVTFIESMILASNYFNTRSPEVLALLSKLFGLPTTEFGTDSVVVPSPSEQVSSKFFGGGAKVLLNSATRACKFFQQRGLTTEVASDQTIKSSINGSFLAKAVAKIGADAQWDPQTNDIKKK